MTTTTTTTTTTLFNILVSFTGIHSPHITELIEAFVTGGEAKMKIKQNKIGFFLIGNNNV